METYTLLYRGAPIGTLACKFVDGFAGGDLVPLPGFDVIRQRIADASRALVNHGFLPPIGEFAGGISPEGERNGAEALLAAEEACREIEVRDGQGRLVAADWINLFGARTPDDGILVMMSIDEVEAAVPALLPPTPREDADFRPTH